jgi:hypothetical protein
MVDMPAAIAENVQQIDWGQLSAKVEDYKPVIDVVRKTWSKESLLDIIQGHISVPDDTINEAIAARIEPDGQVKSLSITSKENGRLEIHADTKKIGRVELSGTVDTFVHHADCSYMSYTVRERALKDHGLMSWFFSRISLSMAERLVGHVELVDDLPTKISGNTITVDFHELLRSSELGQTSIQGYNLLDVLRIEEAVPHDGYIEFKTSLDVPDEVKTMLINIFL